MTYDALVIAAHPDDAETQMGGTLPKLTDRGQRILLVDLTDGEPTEFAEPGIRAQQAADGAHPWRRALHTASPGPAPAGSSRGPAGVGERHPPAPAALDVRHGRSVCSS